MKQGAAIVTVTLKELAEALAIDAEVVALQTYLQDADGVGIELLVKGDGLPKNLPHAILPRYRLNYFKARFLAPSGCKHESTDEEGICRNCGEDFRA